MTKLQHDVSLIINAHKEGRLLHPTMKSAMAAVSCAQANNLNIELIVVVDTPDPETRDFCKTRLPEQTRLIEVAHRDPGLARNAGVFAASGSYIAFLDGDDLIGENWLHRAYEQIVAEQKQVVLHPNYVIYFEGDNAVWKLIDQDSLTFETTLLEHNLWPSASMGRRDTFLDVPFRATDLKNGFGYEDWLFNCDSIARGIIHRTVADTVLCIRKKSNAASQNAQAIGNNCVIAESELFRIPDQHESHAC